MESMNAQPSSWATMPPEILCSIFRGMNRTKMVEMDYFGGHEFLLPSAVVNKHWSAIAVSELYYDVGVDNHSKASRLRKTLESREDLAECVRIVRIGHGSYSEAETKAHATIIRTCPNINTISVSGWNYDALPELLDAIKEKRTLKKIVVSKYNMLDDESDIFCTSMEFLRMMVCWPLLEVVYCHSETLGWEEHDDELISNMRAMDVAHEAEMRQYESEEIAGISDEEEKASRIEWFEKRRKLRADAEREALARTVQTKKAKVDFDVPSAHVNKNPNLRFFRWNEMPWNMDMYALGKLSAMAPNLQHFCTACAFDRSEDLRALIEALRSWKDTLQELHLGDTTGSVLGIPPDLDEVLPELHSLRILWISHRFVKVETLGRLTAPLEYLKYQSQSQSEFELLADVLENSDMSVLPKLTVLRMNSTPFGDNLASPRLRSICKRRGILLNPFEKQIGDDAVEGFDSDEGYESSRMLNYYGNNAYRYDSGSGTEEDEESGSEGMLWDSW